MAAHSFPTWGLLIRSQRFPDFETTEKRLIDERGHKKQPVLFSQYKRLEYHLEAAMTFSIF